MRKLLQRGRICGNLNATCSSAELQARFNSLTLREREVFTLVVTGRPNKQIAAQLELSEMTVKVHRSHITRKMRAKSLVDLVRMADKLGVSTIKL